MEKISGIYKITNTVTGDFYIGSSKDVKLRWLQHKCPSALKKHPNNPMYNDFQKYGTDYFVFEILEKVEPEHLKEKEQQFIEALKPTYNQMNAKGWDIKKKKEYNKVYRKEHKNEMKEYMKEYQKTEKYQESHRKYNNKYYNQLCHFNGETLNLNTLRLRFQKAGIEHSTSEAKKYLLKKEPENVIEFYDIYP